MKERILFECIGQAGGNIGQLFHKKGYITHFINTSNDDLDSLDVREDFKYHIPNAFGCSKDRTKALYFAKDYYNHIVNTIDNRFPRHDKVFFVFSLGGGTGSGLSPVIIDYMTRKNPHKTYGAIVILPSETEPLQAQINAIEAYQQLNKIDNLKNIYVLDNNQSDRFIINQEFVDMFDRLVNITKPDSRGVIDRAELETILSCKGNTVIGYIDYPYSSSGEYDVSLMANKVFAPFTKKCQYMAISIKDRISTGICEQMFGIPQDMFIGYNDYRNMIVLAGLPLSNKRIEILAQRVNSRNQMRNIIEDTEEIAVTIEAPQPKKPEAKPEQKLDFDSLFGKFLD